MLVLVQLLVLMLLLCRRSDLLHLHGCCCPVPGLHLGQDHLLLEQLQLQHGH